MRTDAIFVEKATSNFEVIGKFYFLHVNLMQTDKFQTLAILLNNHNIQCIVNIIQATNHIGTKMRRSPDYNLIIYQR